MNLKTALKEKIPQKYHTYIPRSFEIIGDIAIINIAPELTSYKKVIAQTLASLHSNIKVVLSKTGDIEGEYRLADYELLFGDRTETEYKENTCRFMVDPTKTYFSSKLGTERQRITDQVKDKEQILCMFAGIGPFPINIARKKDVTIHAIEINPDAAKYLEKNIAFNKLKGRITFEIGSVADLVPKLEKKYDRIIMPAPKDAEDFLDLALEKIKKGGIINLYTFTPEEEIETVFKRLEKLANDHNKKIKILDHRLCGNIGICQFRIAVDMKILN
ncbi:MAG: class I SAM-dependent methyltransferase family protein [Candidatus Aenigmarchaeota archaeon]|nr:class I SAM-dependent methyltransferase family protein [Candidatus Aenigmarchaeota archaeon]